MTLSTQVLPQFSPELRGAGRSVSFARVFDAPRDMVWQGFTDGAVLSQWLPGPPGWDMHVCKVSLMAGGGYVWRWRDAKTGAEFGFRGTYSVVEPGRRLIDKQMFDAGDHGLPLTEPIKNTMRFAHVGLSCRVTTTIRYPDAATRDKIVAGGLIEGVEASYQRLDRMLLRAAA